MALTPLMTEVDITVTVSIDVPERLPCPFCGRSLSIWRSADGSVQSMSHGLSGCALYGAWDRSLGELVALALERAPAWRMTESDEGAV